MNERAQSVIDYQCYLSLEDQTKQTEELGFDLGIEVLLEDD